MNRFVSETRRVGDAESRTEDIHALQGMIDQPDKWLIRKRDERQ